MARQPKPKRGVVLLIVLILLMLLIVTALTFAIVSGQFRRAAEAGGRKDLVGDDPRQLLDRAMYQLVRDTPPGVRSSLAGQSLLRDLYGDDFAIGQIVSWTPQPQVGGQFVEIVFNPVAGFRDQAGHYNGGVLTFVRAQDPAGQVTDTRVSVRVVQYNPPGGGSGTLVVELPEGDAAHQIQPVVNSNFVVNGRPFNGTGAGFSQVTGTLDNEVAFPLSGTVPGGYTQPVALLPHYDRYPEDLLNNPSTSPDNGGLDEPWDAVDYQNMFLAMVPADLSEGIIPSFHRPALVNYTLKRFAEDVLVPAGFTDPVTLFRFPYGPDLQPGTSDDPLDVSDPGERTILEQIIELKRMIIMRPLPEDHPEFPNGENFSFTMGMFDSNGTPVGPASQNLSEMVWDIDNDGDGIPDSIWMDAGLPIQTSKDGRRYKPMVAILCQDLDGRLNVNAHSNQWQRQAFYATSNNLSQVPAPSMEGPAPFAGGPPRYVRLPRGLGVGPADIFLGHIFADSSEYENLMNVRYADSILAAAGISNTDDWLSMIKSVGIPRDYVNEVSSYGMPPDLWGRGALGLDYNGQPIPIYSGQAGETVSDPYELVLNREAAGSTDQPYSVAELERLLRWHDLDAASLPDRLLRAAPSTFGGNTPQAQRRRALVTTHSSHLPVPSGMVPKHLQPLVANLADMSATSVLDLYRARLLDGGVAAADVQARMEEIVPWEIWHGEPFNINRWFGNGRDDNGNGVVDEPLEGVDGDGNPLPEIIWPSATPGGFGNNIPFLPTTNARQEYAKHLYCLMMLLTPADYIHPTQENLSPAYRRELTAQRIAQWAVNVVDFRDSDAIMTPFEYDVDPFNDSTIDWDPTTREGGDRRIVWGAEYPDLLLTETTAFHDRRIKDTAFDDNKAKKLGDNPARDDDDLDQFRVPQGSLFLELYCARNRADNNRRFPRELYSVDPRDNNEKLDLARRAPSALYPPPDVVPGMGNNDRVEISWPVWRIVISKPLDDNEGPQDIADQKPDSVSFNPQDMDLVHSVGNVTVGTEQIALERVVWFTRGFSYVTSPDLVGPAAADFDLDAGAAAFRPATLGGTLLGPGGYAVVGPREATTVGMVDDGDGQIMTLTRSAHKLLLPPSASGRTFRVLDNDGNDRYAAPVPPLGIVCGAAAPESWENQRPIGLNVSEPLPQYNYYLEPTYRDTYADPDDPEIPNGLLSIPSLPDRPFDDYLGPLANGGGGGESVNEFETLLDYRAAFLQRLANPLIPFHPFTNPYITVDWATIDLTVYNGEDDPVEEIGEEIHFASRQRGRAGLNDPAPQYGTNYPPSGQLTYEDFTVWNPVAQQPPRTEENNALTSLYFRHNLSHTLGFLNSTMGQPLTGLPAYAGAPQVPFPWLTWNNRPFANPLELMMVPTSTPARLLHEVAVMPAGATVDPFDSQDPPSVQPFRGAFRHLLNFFHSSKTDSGGTPGADFYRLFDFVGTPSPFVGAERWYNPDPDNGHVDTYQPPYNRLSRFQDPGRVNINTINDPDVWEGIAKGYPAMDPTSGIGSEMFSRLFESRRGYAGDILTFNSDYPTFFANPFRSADSADLMPDVQEMRKSEPVQATLLREDVISNRADGLLVPDPNVVAEVEEPHRDQRRNPYFRYQGLARLSNLLTNQSNVFAVWITVGYFEVEPNAGPFSTAGIDIAHPDGYRLGREVGSQSGEVKRHRGFYIIDRSVPVAFQPGENHNVDRAVLLRRFIE